MKGDCITRIAKLLSLLQYPLHRQGWPCVVGLHGPCFIGQKRRGKELVLSRNTIINWGSRDWAKHVRWSSNCVLSRQCEKRKLWCDTFLSAFTSVLIKNVLAIRVYFKIHTAAEQIDPKEIMVLFNKSQKTEQIVQLNRKYWKFCNLLYIKF